MYGHRYGPLGYRGGAVTLYIPIVKKFVIVCGGCVMY